ncbi:hypothetical protein [Microbacterium sp. MYb64]|uniref:hypothetical protein n=1 Tax=Microbacterium sp. MYb64 TaxID=1848691 RepID=UPI0011B09B78|nr:hypothetical protein [Microbacterium sp. MYb64]
MSDYTPTTDEVRDSFAMLIAGDPTDADVAAWLSAHDAEVRSRAIRDAADRVERDFGDRFPGGVLSTRASRRLRAMDEEGEGR